MASINIVLDSNIYDKLEADSSTANAVVALISIGHIEVVMPREVAQELHSRPAGLPTLFTVRFVGNSVARAGMMRAGDMLGDGRFFDSHLGEAKAKKVSDALIADAASWHADWFVSEDGRSRRQFERTDIPTRCVVMDYSEFATKIREAVMAKR